MEVFDTYNVIHTPFIQEKWMYLYGKDNLNRDITWINFDAIDKKDIQKNYDKYIRYYIYISYHRLKKPYVQNYCVFIPFLNFSRFHFKLIRLLKKLHDMALELAPDQLDKNLSFVNNKYIVSIYNTVPFPEHTRNKTILMDKKSACNILEKHMNKNIIPTYLGGDCDHII
jgi:hypothetical protein